MSALNTAQKSALNNLSPAVSAAGLQLGDLVDQILTDLTTGNLGIESDAGDVDSLALGGGAFTQDLDTTTGLTFGYKAGRLFNGSTTISVAAGTVALSASATNYVECSRAGVVSKNTVGFTAKSVPLFTVVTGVSAISSVTSSKDLLGCIPSGGIDGSMLSADAASKSVQDGNQGTISATGAFRIRAPVSGTLAAICIWVTTTKTTDNTDYWAFTAQNKGAAGTGTTDVLNTGDVNTTKATGGSAITAKVARQLTLHGTGANLVVAKGDLIELTATKNGAAANLVDFGLGADFTYTT